MLFTLLIKCEMNCQLSQILLLASLLGEGVVLGWVWGFFFLFFCISERINRTSFYYTGKFNLYYCQIKYIKHICGVFIFRLLTNFFSVRCLK